MRICYVDEAGCTGALPNPSSDVQPVFVLGGVEIPQPSIHRVTHEFLHLKKRFYPNLAPKSATYLDWILTEIKGSELRKGAADPSHRKRRHALGFLHETLSLLETEGARINGRVWIKGIGQAVNGRSIYTFSLQYICGCFNRQLEVDDEWGLLVCDSRNKALNSLASYSVFTQKFKASGDSIPRVLEMPVFGHSENHAGVQIADVICSALLFPLAVHAYCRTAVTNLHVRDYSHLRDRFTDRLGALQVRYCDPQRGGRLTGGVTVDDKIGRRPRTDMFPVPVQRGLVAA
ncbi:MAG TPA: DUF3800 domain-containing protein [Longimicrobium sp.]|jgi:hypothetical protein|uniref:DUF3800 domain-containing protein n=1 Tax=Longimicrobium sp. TaxID=2029185 RepID=UPI002ED95021